MGLSVIMFMLVDFSLRSLSTTTTAGDSWSAYIIGTQPVVFRSNEDDDNDDDIWNAVAEGYYLPEHHHRISVGRSFLSLSRSVIPLMGAHKPCAELTQFFVIFHPFTSTESRPPGGLLDRLFSTNPIGRWRRDWQLLSGRWADDMIWRWPTLPSSVCGRFAVVSFWLGKPFRAAVSADNEWSPRDC